ncbi:MAG: hypothetical protein AB7S75_22830 [Desulfococcaceae bacterium]
MNISQITKDEIRNLSLSEKISIVENILDSTAKDDEYSRLIQSLYSRIFSYHPNFFEKKNR